MYLLSQYKFVSPLLQYIKFKLCSLRLIAGREAEEAKKQEAGVAERTFDSKSADFKELEEPVTHVVPPLKEEAPFVVPPVVTKVPAGKKRKKK